jgi:hypothetical protein
VINTKYFYVTYETVDGEHEYQESGVLQAGDYTAAVAKAERAKPLFDRYGWEEFCRQDNVMEINKGDYIVLRRFVLDIDYYLNEEGRLRI